MSEIVGRQCSQFIGSLDNNGAGASMIPDPRQRGSDKPNQSVAQEAEKTKLVPLELFRFCFVCNILPTLTVSNPADDSLIGRVPDMSEADANVAVDAAFKAFQSWKLTTAKVCITSVMLIFRCFMPRLASAVVRSFVCLPS